MKSLLYDPHPELRNIIYSFAILDSRLRIEHDEGDCQRSPPRTCWQIRSELLSLIGNLAPLVAEKNVFDVRECGFTAPIMWVEGLSAEQRDAVAGKNSIRFYLTEAFDRARGRMQTEIRRVRLTTWLSPAQQHSG
jgi:hypothetical protein